MGKSKNKEKAGKKSSAENPSSKSVQPENSGEKISNEEVKRPGSAVSQKFLPQKQKNVATNWRKNDEEVLQQKQQNFGYVPFKTAPLPIYGIRQQPNAGNLNEIYGIAQSRPNSQITNNSVIFHTGQQPQQQQQPPQSQQQKQQRTNVVVESRPGSEMGMSKLGGSRYGSYTTLPRPEQVEIVEDFPQQQHRYYPQQQQKAQQPTDIYGKISVYGGAHNLYDKQANNIYGAVAPNLPNKPIRSGSALSNRSIHGASGLAPPYMLNSSILGEKSSQILFGGGIYPRDIMDMEELEAIERQNKEIVNWNSLNLSACFQILFGSCIFSIGIARMFLRAEFAKGQEIFYGISVICAGLIGYFSVRSRNYSLAISYFLHSLINAVLIIVPFLSGVVPLLNSAIVSPNSSISQLFPTKTTLNNNGIEEPTEVDLVLVILCVVQFASALIACIYGCRAAGATIYHVETWRILSAQNHQQTNHSKEALIQRLTAH